MYYRCYSRLYCCTFFFFFFNDTATTEIYTLSLHDALPIYGTGDGGRALRDVGLGREDQIPGSVPLRTERAASFEHARSEEHTSELQSLTNLVCRLLLEKKKRQSSIM